MGLEPLGVGIPAPSGSHHASALAPTHGYTIDSPGRCGRRSGGHLVVRGRPGARASSRQKANSMTPVFRAGRRPVQMSAAGTAPQTPPPGHPAGANNRCSGAVVLDRCGLVLARVRVKILGLEDSPGRVFGAAHGWSRSPGPPLPRSSPDRILSAADCRALPGHSGSPGAPDQRLALRSPVVFQGFGQGNSLRFLAVVEQPAGSSGGWSERPLCRSGALPLTGKRPVA